MLDLSAAFDTVNHDILIKRLHEELGIADSSLSWFESYLHNRMQKVDIEGSISNPFDLGCRVPQGLCVSLLFCFILLKASEILHNKMVLAVLRAPVLYFDKTPVGRILNRFSKDIGNLDDVLPTHFLLAVEVSLFSFSTILLPAAANAWLFLVATPVVAIVLYYGRYYMRSSREIKRLEAITCSPVYSHISETIAGLEIIRSSQMEQRFLKSLYK